MLIAVSIAAGCQQKAAPAPASPAGDAKASTLEADVAHLKDICDLDRSSRTPLPPSTDLLFVRRDGRVVKTRAAVKPWRMSGALRAFAVIEMRSGTLAARDTLFGDILEVVAV